MIIIEGPDGAGKTTLVRHLLNRFPETRLGMRGTADRRFLWKVTVQDTMGALAEYARSTGKVVVWDRLYYSELVYAPLSMPPRNIMFNAAQQMHVQEIIEGASFPLILCLPPHATVMENIESEREQMEGVREHASEIWWAYSELMAQLPDRTLVYDYTGSELLTTPLDEIEAEVQDYIDSKRERAW